MGEWIGDHYYYSEGDVKKIDMYGCLDDTYGWEERIVERLDVFIGRHMLKKLGIAHPSPTQIAKYLNGEEV